MTPGTAAPPGPSQSGPHRDFWRGLGAHKREPISTTVSETGHVIPKEHAELLIGHNVSSSALSSSLFLAVCPGLHHLQASNAKHGVHVASSLPVLSGGHSFIMADLSSEIAPKFAPFIGMVSVLWMTRPGETRSADATVCRPALQLPWFSDVRFPSTSADLDHQTSNTEQLT